MPEGATALSLIDGGDATGDEDRQKTLAGEAEPWRMPQRSRRSVLALGGAGGGSLRGGYTSSFDLTPTLRTEISELNWDSTSESSGREPMRPKQGSDRSRLLSGSVPE